MTGTERAGDGAMLLREERDHDRLMLVLDRLRLLTNSDLAALALHDRMSRYMKWSFISGSRNGKILTMKITPGVGPAGMALRLGREYRHGAAAGSVSCDIGHGAGGSPVSPNVSESCPAMLAERLVTAAAYPLLKLDGPIIGGLLLLGRRAGDVYGDCERLAAEESLTAIKAVWSGMTADEMS